MQDSVVTIRTMDCDICQRYDSIMLTMDEINMRCNSTDMGVGAYSVVHSDHTRIIYFDNDGVYLGDTIAMSSEDLPENLQTQPLPYYIRNRQNLNIFSKLRKNLFARLHHKNLTISIAGPSRAGKTSLVKYLETLIPERDGQLSPSVPTMGKSTRHIKIGKSSVKTLDMGGQKDFWDMWEGALRDSNVIFFILDATSNQLLEVGQAFERVIQYRLEEIPILVIMNKKDLALRGEAHRFISSGEFLALTNLKLPIPNVLAIEASVYEGKAYMDFEEVELAEIITDFLKDYVN